MTLSRKRILTAAQGTVKTAPPGRVRADCPQGAISYGNLAASPGEITQPPPPPIFVTTAKFRLLVLWHMTEPEAKMDIPRRRLSVHQGQISKIRIFS